MGVSGQILGGEEIWRKKQKTCPAAMRWWLNLTPRETMTRKEDSVIAVYRRGSFRPL